MVTKSVINVDLADVFSAPDRKGFLHTMAWGDFVDVEEITTEHVKIKKVKYETKPDGSILPVKTEAFITPTKSSKLKTTELVHPKNKNKVLKVNFVDVQQGDGAVIESSDGKVILVDGGDNQLFARYLAARYRGTSAAKPKTIDCILVTHGSCGQRAEEIIQTASLLPPEEQANIADALFRNLMEADYGGEGSEADIQAAWSDEIHQRLSDISTGRIGTVPAEEAERMIRDGKRPEV